MQSGLKCYLIRGQRYYAPCAFECSEPNLLPKKKTRYHQTSSHTHTTSIINTDRRKKNWPWESCIHEFVLSVVAKLLAHLEQQPTNPTHPQKHFCFSTYVYIPVRFGTNKQLVVHTTGKEASPLSPHHSEFVSRDPAQTEKKREGMGGRKSIQQLILHTHGHNERERERIFITIKVKKLTRLMWVGSVCWKKKFRGPNQKISWQWECSKSLLLGFWPTHSLSLFFVKYLCIFQSNNWIAVARSGLGPCFEILKDGRGKRKGQGGEGRGGEAGGGSLPVVFTADKIKKPNRCGWGLWVGKKKLSGSQSKISWQ